jgi:succinate dehydrogenase/fumarate reductase flavoprotein subunit
VLFRSAGKGTPYGGLLLDFGPNLETEQGKRLWERRSRLGQLDAARLAYGEEAYLWHEPWDVAPTAHYNMGGIRVDSTGRSRVSGLYAAGQAMGGIFGADRLGSVSLAEIFVFGEIAGREAAAEAAALPPGPEPDHRYAEQMEGLFGREGKHFPGTLKRRLQRTMWENAGIARDEPSLLSALEEIRLIRADAGDICTSSVKAYNKDVLDSVELNHMLCCAELIVRSALERRETRGAHLRLDCPDKDDEHSLVNILLEKDADGSMHVGREAARRWTG